MGVAVFNWAEWSALYPQLLTAPPAGRSVTEPYATALFNGPAGLLCNNSDCSIIADVTQRGYLLGLIVAHLAFLMGPGSTGQVGRVSQASEGSVSASLDYGTQSKSAAYWLQSPYGALYWQMTAWTRTFQYVPAPPSAPEAAANGFWPAGAYRQPGQW